MITAKIDREKYYPKPRDMVNFSICEGNPGALTFLMDAYTKRPVDAEMGFRRMRNAGITGSRLYMIWNDCCNRVTEKAIDIMNKEPIESIREHISRPYGVPFTEEEGAEQ